MPDRIRELRALIGTTANKTYVAASNAAWAAGTAYVLPITAIDVSKLVHQGIESKVLTRRMHEAAQAKSGLSASELPFSIPLGMGSADTTAPFDATHTTDSIMLSRENVDDEYEIVETESNIVLRMPFQVRAREVENA